MTETETGQGRFLHRVRGTNGRRIRSLAERLQYVAAKDGAQVPSVTNLMSNLVNLCIAMGLNEFEKMDTQRLRDLLELSGV